MARPRLAKPTQEIRARIEIGVYSRIQMLLYSPADGKMRYGALGKITERLLATWLHRVDKAGFARALKDIGIQPGEIIPGLTEENDHTRPQLEQDQQKELPL